MSDNKEKSKNEINEAQYSNKTYLYLGIIIVVIIIGVGLWLSTPNNHAMGSVNNTSVSTNTTQNQSQSNSTSSQSQKPEVASLKTGLIASNSKLGASWYKIEMQNDTVSLWGARRNKSDVELVKWTLTNSTNYTEVYYKTGYQLYPMSFMKDNNDELIGIFSIHKFMGTYVTDGVIASIPDKGSPNWAYSYSGGDKTVIYSLARYNRTDAIVIARFVNRSILVFDVDTNTGAVRWGTRISMGSQFNATAPYKGIVIGHYLYIVVSATVNKGHTRLILVKFDLNTKRVIAAIEYGFKEDFVPSGFVHFGNKNEIVLSMSTPGRLTASLIGIIQTQNLTINFETPSPNMIITCGSVVDGQEIIGANVYPNASSIPSLELLTNGNLEGINKISCGGVSNYRTMDTVCNTNYCLILKAGRVNNKGVGELVRIKLNGEVIEPSSCVKSIDVSFKKEMPIEQKDITLNTSPISISKTTFQLNYKAI